MITALMICMVMRAADGDVEVTVKIEYNDAGTEVAITVPEEISQYVNIVSGTAPHVKIQQSLTKADNPNNYVIVYSISGTTNDGSFTLEADIKSVVELNNLTMTNPSGAAINLQNGKNNKIYVKKGTTNSLADAANDETKGCIHCEGHLEFKKTGTLNIVGNNSHAVYSKEYVQIAKPTINITGAKKDGFHCKQYFWMEDACTVTISNVGDDGIQVERIEEDAYTGPLPGHEDVDEHGEDFDENSGYFYQDNGTLTISDFAKKAIKADGKIMFNGGTQNFDTTAIKEDNNPATGIATLRNNAVKSEAAYDLNGRQLKAQKKGVVIQNGKKIIMK